MFVLVTIIHIIVCLFLIIVVLLQSGQSGDIAAAFGGMGSQTAFGTRTAATVLSKATTYAAIIFMLTSIALTVFAARRGHASGSVFSGTKSAAPAKTAPAQSKPANPAQQPPAPEPQPMAK
jgi:preprotein translocase subunit SecG